MIGTIWQTGINFLPGVRTIRINSINTSNHTINFEYGYSSLTQSEICKYEIKEDPSRYGNHGSAIVVPSTYDFYNLEIFDDRVLVVWGSNMKKITN